MKINNIYLARMFVNWLIAASSAAYIGFFLWVAKNKDSGSGVQDYAMAFFVIAICLTVICFLFGRKLAIEEQRQKKHAYKKEALLRHIAELEVQQRAINLQIAQAKNDIFLLDQ